MTLSVFVFFKPQESKELQFEFYKCDVLQHPNEELIVDYLSLLSLAFRRSLSFVGLFCFLSLEAF